MDIEYWGDPDFLGEHLAIKVGQGYFWEHPIEVFGGFGEYLGVINRPIMIFRQGAKLIIDLVKNAEALNKLVVPSSERDML